jgi:tetratricopeptide (TPR) repeat protein
MFKAKPTFIQRVLLIGLLCMLLDCLAGSIFAQKIVDDKNKISEAQQTKAEMFFYEGLRLKALGDYRTAVINFDKVIAIDPNQAAAFYELSQMYLEMKTPETAFIYALKAATLDPKNEWYLIAAAEASEKSGNYLKAQKFYQALIELKPAHIENYFSLANMQLARKKYKDALRTYDILSKKLGVTEELAIQKEKIWLKLNKVPKALAEIQTLIDRYPKEPRYYLLLADIFVANNTPDKAFAIYQKVLQLDSNNGYAQLELAEYYRIKKQEPMAMRYLYVAFKNPQINIDHKVSILAPYFSVIGNQSQRKRALELASFLIVAHPAEAKAFAIYADLLYQDKQLDSAKKIYLQTIALDKSVFAVWQNLLLLQAETQDYNGLLKSSNQAIELFPNQNFVFYLNAAAKYQAKDYAAAALAYKQALAITFDNKEMQAQIYSGLGDVYNELKQYAQSDSFYNASLTLKPDEVFVLNNYAYYLALRKEQLPKAAQMAKKANELQPNNASFEDTYAWVLFKMGNYEQALIWIELALTHSETQTATLMEHYGDILYFLTKKDAAVQAIEKWKAAKTLGAGSEQLSEKIKEGKWIE